MSGIETQHGAYLGSELVAGEYAVERTPLLSSRLRSGRSKRWSRAPSEELQDPEEEPTMPLLLNQTGILLKSSLPIFGTHLLEYALLITSVLAVGHLGKLELAACTLGSMTANVTAFSIILGLGGALDTVLPGIWGASASRHPVVDSPKADPTHKIADSRIFGLWCQRMAVIYCLILVPMLLVWLNAEGILLFLRQDEQVARLASRYLARLSWGLPAYMLTTITKRFFQAQGLFSVPTKIGTVVAGINVILTVVLVYYPNPLPRSLAPYLHLGFDGAPLAIAISYNLVAVASIYCGWRIEVARRKRREELEARLARAQSIRDSGSDFDTTTLGSPSTAASSRTVSRDASPSSRFDRVSTKGLERHELRSAWHPLSTRAFHPTGLATLLQFGLGGVGQIASEWWAWELVGLAAAALGPTALAAQSVLLVSTSTTFQAPFALGIATSVRIGQLLGLAQPRLARLATYAGLLLGLATSFVISSFYWIWRNQWAYLFTDDADVVSIVAEILPIIALFQIFDGNAAITGGVLRARGKQGTGALLNLSAYYVIGIPLGLYLAFKDVGFPDSLPDHPVVNSVGNRLAALLSPSSLSTSALSSLHFKPTIDPMYPSLAEATAGLRGLWIGLTVSLVYCSVLGTILCLQTDWDHEVEKVRLRMRKEERRGQRDAQSEDTNDGATFVQV